MSSGPDIVHDEEVSESSDCAVLSLCSLSLFLAARSGGVGLDGPCSSSGLLSLAELVDAITQDSPRTERSGVRGCSDMV